MQPPDINSAVSALRFFFTVTLDRPDLSRRLTLVHQPRKLPLVLSVEEVARLFEEAPGNAQKESVAAPALMRSCILLEPAISTPEMRSSCS
jgi:integrase/recombinase XerD